VRDDERPFALIGRWAGGGALVGSQPVRVADRDDDPFQLVEELPLIAAAGGSGGSVGVGGGWFGYLGYGLAGRVEEVGASPPSGCRLPDFELAFYDHLLHRDDRGRWWFEALWTPARGLAIRGRLLELGRRGRATPRPRAFATTPWAIRPGAGGHASAVEACRERVHAGDLFQANLSVRASARITGDPIDLFVTAAAGLRPDRAAFAGGPWGAIASLSPELFIERHGRGVRSAPIKGTARRMAEAGGDRASAGRLGASAKNRAENVMIVDLVRNDLGRVCEPGSIRVVALAAARAHAGVWHLVSEVVGSVAADLGDGALVRAAFPPGSVTGAPKVAAIDVIAELESSAREVYTGAIGFASPAAGLELSVAIRTFEFAGEDVWLGVGGGIVADSDPAEEVAECLTKLEPLLAAIGGRLAADPRLGGSLELGLGGPLELGLGGPLEPGLGGPHELGLGGPADRAPAAPAGTVPAGGQLRGAPLPGRLGARPVRRPDPRAGVFETLLVLAGRPVEVELHLARLAASVESLYGRRLPGETGALVVEAAAGERGSRARLRVTARPARGGLELTVRSSPLPATRPPVTLRTVTIPGGLGAHKWVDRRLIEAFEADVAPRQPVFCDVDGLVLEASRSNVFVVDGGGTLVTPPVGGRLLPGVTRGSILGIAGRLGLDVRVEEVSVERLARAREVFVSGSIGRVEAVESWDGRLIGPAGPISLMLGRALAQAGTDSASPAASRSASALVVCSQVKSSSSRPK
jgi:para-aminobenzoate synthetase/4-amino-4-deoxychorismate lyase